jgi:hypothetical protein
MPAIFRDGVGLVVHLASLARSGRLGGQVLGGSKTKAA